MLEVGQEVMVMSVPGRCRIVAIHGDQVTIEDAAGRRKTVLARSLRVVPPKPA